jgi:uncharacterized membrane protein
VCESLFAQVGTIHFVIIMVLFLIQQVSANNYRPDLTKPTLARLTAVYRSLQVAKSGVKKKNRQA